MRRDGLPIAYALDFYLKGKRLYFSHAYTGSALDEFIAALNDITVLYKNKPGSQRIICVELLGAGNPYFAVFSGVRLTLYAYHINILKKITRKQLLSKWSTLKGNTKSFT